MATIVYKGRALTRLIGRGGGGGRKKYKKYIYSRKGKLNAKKFMHAN